MLPGPQCRAVAEAKCQSCPWLEADGGPDHYICKHYVGEHSIVGRLLGGTSWAVALMNIWAFDR
eukprot:1146071-Pelagomonas_calceolata.AAC.2